MRRGRIRIMGIRIIILIPIILTPSPPLMILPPLSCPSPHLPIYTRVFWVLKECASNSLPDSWPRTDAVVDDLEHLLSFRAGQGQAGGADPFGAQAAFLDGQLDVLNKLHVGI